MFEFDATFKNNPVTHFHAISSRIIERFTAHTELCKCLTTLNLCVQKRIFSWFPLKHEVVDDDGNAKYIHTDRKINPGTLFISIHKLCMITILLSTTLPHIHFYY